MSGLPMFTCCLLFLFFTWINANLRATNVRGRGRYLVSQDERSSPEKSRGPLAEDLHKFMKRPASDKLSKSRKNVDLARNGVKSGFQNTRLKDEGHRSWTPGSEEDDRHKFRYDVSLDTTGEFFLFWDTDFNREIITFHLEASVRRSDVLAFGFSAYGEAQNADFVILWTDYTGRQRFQDTHTDADGILHLDRHQDYILDSVNYKNPSTEVGGGGEGGGGRGGGGRGFVTVDFHRLFDTCDDDDDYLIDSGTTHLIFFVGRGPVADVRRWNVTREQPRLQRVQLLKSQLPDPEFPPDTKSFVMHVDDVPIPEDETTYWCSVQKLPDFKEKHHIIQFEGAISEGSKGIVHHLEVFHCQVPVGVDVSYYNAPCSSKSERPKGLESCTKVIGAWAMGAKPLSYPEEAGAAIGGPNFNRYVMLEVHYNNPEHKKAIVDSSGIRFYYTRNLRKYDAGTMELGLEYTDKMALPPGQPRWDLIGYCIPECTQRALPVGGIKVFASQLHTHLTGRSAYTKHFRKGVELPELNRDNHFSPHYQEIRKLPRQVHVLPGDALVTTCVDRTLDRKEITLGGFSISDEMCVNYVHYYPATDLEVCKSSVTTDSLYRFFQFLHEYQDEATSRSRGIAENYKSIRWTRMNVEMLRTYYEVAPLSMQCNQSNGHKFPGFNWENTRIPTILAPMPPKERPCLE